MKKIRDLERTRSEILKVTFEEIYKNGFQGVSIDDIVKKTGLTKGALYHQFPTKLDLGYALVDEVITPMIIDRWITPLEGFDDPVEGILAVLHELIGKEDPKNLKLGCPLNNLVQEMAPVDKGFKLRLEKALHLWIDELDAQLVRGKKNGHVREDVKTKDVAYFVVMAHEGFYGMIKGIGSERAYRPLHESLKAYLKTISK